MMQNKMVKDLLIGLFIFNLTACASHQVQNSASIKSPADNNQDIFIDSSIARFMENVDHSKLQNLVATAQAKELIIWTSNVTGARFAFTSKDIFVNSEGQVCRGYEITLIRGFFEHPSFNYTACRNNEGVWHVMSH